MPKAPHNFFYFLLSLLLLRKLVTFSNSYFRPVSLRLLVLPTSLPEKVFLNVNRAILSEGNKVLLFYEEFLYSIHRFRSLISATLNCHFRHNFVCFCFGHLFCLPTNWGQFVSFLPSWRLFMIYFWEKMSERKAADNECEVEPQWCASQNRFMGFLVLVPHKSKLIYFLIEDSNSEIFETDNHSYTSVKLCVLI